MHLPDTCISSVAAKRNVSCSLRVRSALKFSRTMRLHCSCGEPGALSGILALLSLFLLHLDRDKTNYQILSFRLPAVSAQSLLYLSFSTLALQFTLGRLYTCSYQQNLPTRKGHGFELHGMLLMCKSLNLFQIVATLSLFTIYLALILENNQYFWVIRFSSLQRDSKSLEILLGKIVSSKITLPQVLKMSGLHQYSSETQAQ